MYPYNLLRLIIGCHPPFFLGTAQIGLRKLPAGEVGSMAFLSSKSSTSWSNTWHCCGDRDASGMGGQNRGVFVEFQSVALENPRVACVVYS